MEEGLLKEIYGKILKIEREIDELKIVLIPEEEPSEDERKIIEEGLKEKKMVGEEEVFKSLR
ncbi:MAG: hypothetical protein J7L10_06340 [Methanomicrobia archaeon]|nr:hypothetical protein [Methanomicrobia archaeon]MCK4636495.1 hypothetical protein [Methanomicrobia archaeon]RLG01195.1 MAG: hypothetical protein DRN58_02240 [Thermococci archaeon]